MEGPWELAALVMAFSRDDVEQRQPIWDAMQMIWMDTDVDAEVPNIISICSESNYKISEIEEIYWNEVRPVVSKNMLIPVIAPEWVGYELDWLSDKIMNRLLHGKTHKKSKLRWYSYGYWKKIEEGLLQSRSVTS